MVLEVQDGQDPAGCLIEHIFGEVRERYLERGYFSGKAILTPINADVYAINDAVMDSLPGEPVEYTSLDCVEERDEV